MYIVYRQRRGNQTDVGIADPSGETPGTIISCARTQQEANVHEDAMPHTLIDAFWTKGRGEETNARRSAEFLATMFPGDDIFIAKVEAVASAPPGKAVIKAVNEKGILPT